MIQAQHLPRSAWSILPLLIVNWIAFANVVSLSGLFSWVIVPSVITVQVMLVMIQAERRLLAGFVLVLLSVVAVGLSQLIGGTLSGPITRSTLMMTTCTGLMVLLWRTRFPASAVLVSLAALSGALGLGAAQRIVWLVGVWAVAVVTYLVAVGPLRSEDLRDPGRLRRFAALLLVGGLIATLAGNGLDQMVKDAWRLRQVGAMALGGTSITSTAATSSPNTSWLRETIRGSARDMSRRTKGLNQAGSVRGSAGGMSEYRPVEVPDYVPRPNPAATPRSLIATVALVIAGLVLLLLLLLAVWIALVQLKWLLLKMRLRRGTSAEQVAGAWHWLRLRWAQSGYFEYVNLTPDRISRLASKTGDPQLQSLADAASQALYARQPDLNSVHAKMAWQTAQALRRRVRGNFPQRVRALFATPSASSRRLTSREWTVRPGGAQHGHEHRNPLHHG